MEFYRRSLLTLSYSTNLPEHSETRTLDHSAGIYIPSYVYFESKEIRSQSSCLTKSTIVEGCVTVS
jgi:hypothetical protein